MYCIESQGIVFHGSYEVWVSFWYLPRSTPTNDKPNFEWGDYYARKTNRESYFDRRSQQFFPSSGAIDFKCLCNPIQSTFCIL